MSILLVTQAIPEPQVAYGYASITSSYTLAGAFTVGISLMKIISTLNAAVQISFDGTNDHVAVPAGNSEPVFMDFDFVANLMVFAGVVPIYVKQIGDPTLGSLYVTGFSRKA